MPDWWILAVLLLAFAVAGCAGMGGDVPTDRSPTPSEPAEEDFPEVRADGEAPSRGVGGVDARPFFSVRGQVGARLSEGGDRVVFLSNVTGSAQAWRLDSPMGWPHQVTHFADRATMVRWTPMADRLLVSGDVGGDERDDLLTVALDGSEPVVLARGDEGRNIPGGFTPDGASVVISSTRRHPAFF
ncbi:MAG: TolB family protein, partial [Planctomycetota bacterium]